MRSAFVPFRLSLFGGGADFPSFYRENPYQGLGVSLKQGALITFNDRCFHPENYRLGYSQIETAQIEEILHPLVRQIFTHCKISKVNCYTSDFPSESGLGTSSAFAIGLFMSLLGRAKLENMRCPEMGIFSGKVNSISDKLASLAIHAERLSLAEAGGVKIKFFVRVLASQKSVMGLMDGRQKHQLPEHGPIYPGSLCFS